MNPYLGYEIVLLLVALYAFVIYALQRAGRLGPGKPLSMFGPALMIKTQRGRAALDRWGRFVDSGRAPATSGSDSRSSRWRRSSVSSSSTRSFRSS